MKSHEEFQVNYRKEFIKDFLQEFLAEPLDEILINFWWNHEGTTDGIHE